MKQVKKITTLKIQENELTVILFVGVNGVGKTTTIGKLAHRLKSRVKNGNGGRRYISCWCD